MSEHWIADRMRHIDASGIRKVFDLAANLTDPIDLSIGQPEFDVPDSVKRAAIEAIESGRNGYTVTQGIAPLREKLQAWVDSRYQHPDRELFVSSGTSGALVLALSTLVNPGDEVIQFDPYFVMYPHLVALVGGRSVFVDTYPDFRIDLDRVQAAITPRTKCILVNSPANPTGVVAREEELRGLAQLAAEHDVALISDEVYRAFCYGAKFHSPAEWDEKVIVVDGFSKTYGMTGWRLGFVHGPSAVIREMIKLQQYTFVCAPQPVQWAGIEALDVDMTSHIDDYRRKRDMVVAGLADDYELVHPAGAFYVFPKVPWGTGDQFVHRAVEDKLLIIPGNIFSDRNTHVRIPYAASDATPQRGLDVLRNLARNRP